MFVKICKSQLKTLIDLGVQALSSVKLTVDEKDVISFVTCATRNTDNKSMLVRVYQVVNYSGEVENLSLYAVNDLAGTNPLNPDNFTFEDDEGCCSGDSCLAVNFEGFDYLPALNVAEPGSFTTYSSGTSNTPDIELTMDYTTTSDGTNKTSWYTPLINQINQLPNWSIQPYEDVSVDAEGKPKWYVEYTGDSPDTLTIKKSSGTSMDTTVADVITIKADPTSNSITIESDHNSTGVPFASFFSEVVTCN